MLDAILKFSLDNRLAAFVLATIIACWGYYAYSGLTVEAFPDPTDTQVQVGFIALLGQAVLNGVLVVAAIRARIDAKEPLLDAVMNGARDRLRAVLMTALLASLGMVPAAMSHAIGSETQRPIAVVVVSGTISAAVLTLLVLPVTYYFARLVRERVTDGPRDGMGAVSPAHDPGGTSVAATGNPLG